MNFNEVKKDVDSRNNRVKIESGASVKVQFTSEEFTKVEKDYKNDGNITIKYQLPCVCDGIGGKVYEGSYTFYSKCFAKANNRSKKLTDLVFIITKTGEGLKTEYDIDVYDGSESMTKAPW